MTPYSNISREDLEKLYDAALERNANLVMELRRLSNKWHRLYHNRRISLEQCDRDDCIKRTKLINLNRKK